MTKKLLLRAFFLLTASTLLIVNGGCTSKKAEDTQAVLDNADIEKIEADGLDLNSADPTLDLATSNEVVPSQGPTLDTPPAAPTTETVAAPTETVVATTESKDAAQEPVIEPSAPAQAPKDGNAELSLDYPAESQLPEAAATPTEPTPPADAAATTEAMPAPEAAAVVAAPAAKPAAPLKKVIETLPYQHTDGTWINTVYIARPKEKLADISMKIYGMDKSTDLKNIAENKYLKTRSVRSGDKIYYSSPNRPDDSTKMLSHYEDIGAVPETYVAKKGDNLKKVSTKLLGFDSAWKEVWSTNNMTSKSALKEGEMIRFWKPADTTPAPETAKANLIDSAPATAINPTTPPVTSEAPALPPPPPEAQAQMPPPPPPDMGTAEMPPPPPADMMPPPAPEAQASAEVAKPRKKINLDEAAAEEDESETEALDSDTMTSLGALGILVALMAYVIIRKKKQKAAQMAESQMGPEINA